ncbi:unnamed protein product [Lymnaea stagnalis]|uniref:JmjC domain-containing protein n=1 Tax=Lymnaea stagnalis TaxID=6523 RepID=A0AAV2IEP0_LYMST
MAKKQVNQSASPKKQRNRPKKRTTPSTGSVTDYVLNVIPVHLHSLTIAQATALVVGLTLSTLILFKEVRYLDREASQEERFGGWRPASDDILQKYGSDVCSVERVSVHDLSPERFEEEFRFKKSVLVTFPKGSAGWTDPYQWSRQGLVDAYSSWAIHSGQSLEIVRAGGNAKHKTSFLDFVEKLLDNPKNGTQEPMNYGFDRHFYWETKLPETLRLPKYFQVNNVTEDSIFFLGSSMTGVVFHKHSDTWNGVVYGQKRWFLYPTNKSPPGGIHHGYSLLDWVNNVYPNLPEADKPMECVQEAGEILYLPEGMYHATLNLGDTIALAIQKKTATLPSEVLSYEATSTINMLQDSPDNVPVDKFHQRLKEIYEKWHELLPENAEAVEKLGGTLYDMGQYKESLPLLMKAIKLDPYFVLAYVHMAKTLSKLREYQRAEVVFQKAMEVNPNLWDIYKEYGEFLLKQGRPADALPIYKKGTELMPDLMPFWQYYKYCQQQVGDLEGAEETERAIVDLQAKKDLNNS